MVIDPIRFQVDQVSRILSTLGWEVVAWEAEGEMVKITVVKPKKEITG